MCVIIRHYVKSQNEESTNKEFPSSISPTAIGPKLQLNSGSPRTRGGKVATFLVPLDWLGTGCYDDLKLKLS